MNDEFMSFGKSPARRGAVTRLCHASAAEKDVQVLQQHFSVGEGLQLHLVDFNPPLPLPAMKLEMVASHVLVVGF